MVRVGVEDAEKMNIQQVAESGGAVYCGGLPVILVYYLFLLLCVVVL